MSDRKRPARSTLRRRIAAWLSVAFLSVLILVGTLVQVGARASLIDQLADDLAGNARLIALDVEDSIASPERLVERARALDARITVIASDGSVVADTVSDPTTMENHADRPEFIAAMAGVTGRSVRFSDTTQETRLYVAIPPENDLIVRLSVTQAEIADELSTLTTRVIAIIAGVGLLGVLLVMIGTARLVRPIAALTRTADRIASGQLDLAPNRSSIVELDRLGQSVGGMAADLGRRIKAAENERETLDVILAALPEGVILVEPDDRVAFANRSAGEILGFVPKRLPTLAPASLQRVVRSARESGRIESVQIEHGSPLRMLRATATPFRENFHRVLLVVVDVTEQHRLDSVRRDFVADASHELKTPIASILASLDAFNLSVEHDPLRASEFAAQIETAAQRLARIVSDLLDLSRLEASSGTDERCALATVVVEETNRLRSKATQAGIRLDVDVVLVEVRGSAADWVLAVRNLCENAIQYTESGGAVTVTLSETESAVELVVSDTGVGIPTRAIPRVFERFYRVDAARTRDTGGTGLGLAIVKHVAERHGGTVVVASEFGAGSTFTVSIQRE